MGRTLAAACVNVQGVQTGINTKIKSTTVRETDVSPHHEDSIKCRLESLKHHGSMGSMGLRRAPHSAPELGLSLRPGVAILLDNQGKFFFSLALNKLSKIELFSL